jgi:hypothetical protein
MTILLRPETQRLLEERMKKDGCSDPEAVVHLALEALDQVEGEPLESLDEETQAAIERAEAQSALGEGRPWTAVKDDLKARFLKA